MARRLPAAELLEQWLHYRVRLLSWRELHSTSGPSGDETRPVHLPEDPTP